MKKRAIALMLSILMLIAVFAGCASKPEEAPKEPETPAPTEEAPETEKAPENAPEAEEPKEGGRKFGYTYWAASDFFSTIGDSIKEIASANGDEVIVVDAQQDQAKQISIIEDFITQGVDAVFLNPVDREGIEPALDMLNEANIPIINVDTGVASIEKVNSYVASDNYGAGVMCAETMIKLLPDGGEIAILDYPANTACVDRVAGFLATIEGKNFTVVSQQDAQGKPDPGLAKTQDILQANPGLVAVFACNDQCGQGAYAAINEAQAKAIVLGVDGSPEGKEYISEGGAFVATAAQSPKQIGKLSIETAYAVLNGEAYETNISVPTFIIDADNVAEYKDGWQ